jgi:hypothetical protein
MGIFFKRSGKPAAFSSVCLLSATRFLRLQSRVRKIQI